MMEKCNVDTRKQRNNLLYLQFIQEPAKTKKGRGEREKEREEIERKIERDKSMCRKMEREHANTQVYGSSFRKGLKKR